MAQKVVIQLVDDLDGTNSQDVSTVLFDLDGTSYEIDLSDTNAQQLRDNLATFIDSARRASSRTSRGVRPLQRGTAVNPGETAQIREWALENGYEPARRGYIASDLVEMYRKAQSPAKTSKKGTANRRTHAKKS